MAAIDINDYKGLALRSVSRKSPKHYKLSIKSFSRLKSLIYFESSEFEAGGYKWKLVLFPNGNKNRGVEGHISLYLEMGGKTAINPWKIVTIDYKLFLLNRTKKTYLVLEDSDKEEKKYCIYRTIVGGLAGFDRFISLKEFNDASNGYLIDDGCEFGAEVFVSETTRKGKTEEFINNFNTVMYRHDWKVTNFSKLAATHHYSQPFTADNQKYCAWRLLQCCSIPRDISKERVVMSLSFCLWIIQMSFLPDRKYLWNILYAFWIKSMGTIVLPNVQAGFRKRVGGMSS